MKYRLSAVPPKMIARQIIRGIHTNFVLHNVDRKYLLGELRKKTGFSFSNCKRALEENGNDLAKAKEWLIENAQKEGWVKAGKLGGRPTSQGLIALTIQKNYAALIELNCETDFVARNEKFHELAEKTAAAVLNHGMSINSDLPINKILLEADNLKELKADDGKLLADHTALMIGVIGENINLKRALCMNVSNGIQLFGCTHPVAVNPGSTLFGKYAALVALNGENDAGDVGTQLCQHIIGMRPQKIGNPDADKPNKNSEEELTLLFQDFLLDPDLSVQQFLQRENISILDFVRFEVGEQAEQEEQKETAAEACA